MNQNQPKASKQTLWILWSALLFSLFLLLGIRVFVLENQRIDPQIDNFSLYLSIFASLSVILIFLSEMFYRKATIGSPKEVTLKIQTHYIVSWALGQSIAIYGLPLFILLGEQSLVYSNLAFAVGIGLHIYHRPVV